MRKPATERGWAPVQSVGPAAAACIAVVALAGGCGAGGSKRDDTPASEPAPRASVTSAPLPTSAAGAPTSTGSGAVRPVNHEIRFEHGGLDRSVVVHLPTRYDGGARFPVVIALHGGFGSPAQFERSSGFSDIADARGFIVAYGQGTAWGRLAAPVWNAGGCCGQAVDAVRDVDDVGYIREVIAHLTAAYRIDSARVYVAGMSNGAMMANRVACDAADLVAGVAAVSGTVQDPSCDPTRPVPVLMMHGTADDNVPYDGGVGTVALNQADFVPVEQAIAVWAGRNGCEGPAITETDYAGHDDGITVDRLTFAACEAATVLYRLNGGVHEWPGGSSIDNPLERRTPTTSIDAGETIADFFGL